MPYSNISAAISPANIAAIEAKLNEVTNMVPTVVNLTPEERITILKLGDGSLPFVAKAYEYAASNTHLIPPYLNMAEGKKDFQYNQDLSRLSHAVAQLQEKLDDTRMAVGSEAFQTALAFYNIVKQAAKANVPGTDTIYEDLKARFAISGVQVESLEK